MQRLKYLVSIAGLLGLVLALLLAPWGGLLAAAQTALAPISVVAGAFAVGVNPTTNRIYVVSAASFTTRNTVSVIDGATNALVGTVPVDFGASGVAVNSTTNRVYVANSGPGATFDANGCLSSAVTVIDGSNNAVVTSVPTGGFCSAGVAVIP
jgi:DNA-binding beta-propeller fold protein YncE